MLYVWSDNTGHCIAVPVIRLGEPGAAGLTVAANVLAELVPQLLPAVTLTSPFSPGEPVVTVTDIVPCPAVITQPEGTVHVYVVAFATEFILYICPFSPGH